MKLIDNNLKSNPIEIRKIVYAVIKINNNQSDQQNVKNLAVQLLHNSLEGTKRSIFVHDIEYGTNYYLTNLQELRNQFRELKENRIWKIRMIDKDKCLVKIEEIEEHLTKRIKMSQYTFVNI